MANQIKIQEGTRLSWKASGGDYTFTPKNIANAAGRLGARGDLGAFPHGAWFRWFVTTQCQATPTVGALIRIYLSFWDTTSGPGGADGDVGSADAAFATENDLLNLKLIGSVVCDTAAADTIFQRSGLIFVPVRYVSPVWWNASGAALTNDDAEHEFALTPAVPEIQ